MTGQPHLLSTSAPLIGLNSADAPRDLSRAAAAGGLSVAVTLALLLGGYQYGVDDQDEQLAVVLRILDPDYLPGDWYLDTQGGPGGARYAFAWIVAQSARLLTLPMACAFWQVAAIAAVLGAVMHLARSLHGTRAAGAAAALVLSLYLAQDKAGWGYGLWSNALIPQNAAVALAAWVYAWAADGRMGPALLLASAGVWLHPQAGQYPLIVVGILCVWPPRGMRRPSAAWYAAAGVLAAPVEWLLFQQAVASPTPQVFLQHLEVRLPHHYLPECWRLSDVLCAAAAAALVMWHCRAGDARRQPAAAAAVARMTALIVVGAAVYVVAVQAGSGGLLVKAHFARHGAMVIVFAAAVCGGSGFQMARAVTGPACGNRLAAARRSAAERCLGWAAFVVTALWPGSAGVEFALSALAAIRKSRADLAWLHRVAIGVVPATALVIGAQTPAAAVCRAAVALAAIAALRPCGLGMGAGRRVPSGVVTTIAAIAGVAAVLPNCGVDWRTGGALHAFRSRIPGPQNDVERLAVAAATGTRPGAQIALPPQTVRLRLLGNRSPVVSLKNNPYDPRFVLEWHARLWECATGAPAFGTIVLPIARLDAAYRHITADGLEFLAARYGATHAIVPAESPAASKALVVASAGRWRLVAVPSSGAHAEAVGERRECRLEAPCLLGRVGM